MIGTSAKPLAYSYIRMSSTIQLKGDSLRRQLEASARFADEHDLDLLDKHRLRDIGSAFKGANLVDGDLGEFLRAVKAKKVPAGSYLLVESLDRLSREQLNKSLALFLDIINSGIVLVTLADNKTYTANNPQQLTDLIYSLIIMSRANEESQTKSLRVGAAWANKRANATNAPLTAICPAWLRLSRNRDVYEIIEDRAQIVRRIFQDSASGIGNYAITTRLNKQGVPHFGKSNGWHQSYVAKILKNRSVIGEFQPHKVADGKRRPCGDAIAKYFPAIVEEGMFYAAQTGLAERRRNGRGRKGAFVSNLFSGLLRCAYCKSSIKFENKGPPPKGAIFLVCDGGRRGLNCTRARWRYDHFETSFLAFVRAIDLDKLVRGDDDAKQQDLDREIAALEGERQEIEKRMKLTFELWETAAEAKEIVADRLKEHKAHLDDVEAKLKEKEKEKIDLKSSASQFYESKEKIKGLIAQVQAKEGDEVYKLRSQISSKLKSLVQRVYLAPLGSAPLIEKSSDAGLTEKAQKSKKLILGKPAYRRRFVGVAFADGSACVVYPSDHDPLQFEQQFLDNSGGGIFKFGPWLSGYPVRIPPVPTLDDEDALAKAVFDSLA